MDLIDIPLYIIVIQCLSDIGYYSYYQMACLAIKFSVTNDRKYVFRYMNYSGHWSFLPCRPAPMVATEVALGSNGVK